MTTYQAQTLLRGLQGRAELGRGPTLSKSPHRVNNGYVTSLAGAGLALEILPFLAEARRRHLERTARKKCGGAETDGYG